MITLKPKSLRLLSLLWTATGGSRKTIRPQQERMGKKSHLLATRTTKGGWARRSYNHCPLMKRQLTIISRRAKTLAQRAWSALTQEAKALSPISSRSRKVNKTTSLVATFRLSSRDRTRQWNSSQVMLWRRKWTKRIRLRMSRRPEGTTKRKLLHRPPQLNQVKLKPTTQGQRLLSKNL